MVVLLSLSLREIAITFFYMLYSALFSIRFRGVLIELGDTQVVLQVSDFDEAKRIPRRVNRFCVSI